MAMTPERFRYVVWQSVPAGVFTVAATVLSLGAGSPWWLVGAGAAATGLMLVLAWRAPKLPPEETATELDLRGAPKQEASAARLPFRVSSVAAVPRRWPFWRSQLLRADRLANHAIGSPTPKA